MQPQNPGMCPPGHTHLRPQVLLDFTEYTTACDSSPLAVQEQASQLLPPAVDCLAAAHDMPVRVCACRAVAQLLPRAARAQAQPHLQRAYASLIDLMGQADQDVLNLVLETLHVRPYATPVISNACADTQPFPRVLALGVHMGHAVDGPHSAAELVRPWQCAQSWRGRCGTSPTSLCLPPHTATERQ